MWFERMPLEEWFDAWQYRAPINVAESAVRFLTLRELGIDLADVPLRYGHHAGAPDLRALAAEEYPDLQPEHVVVTSGAAEAIFSIAAALLKPGDHVVVEHPNYPSTYEVPRGLGCEVSLFPLRFEDAYKPDLQRLHEFLTPRTKLIVFTHPNNPTGSMISEHELAQLLHLAESRGIYVLFDETYRHLTYGEPLPPAAALSPRAISVTTMSKSYGLPGIRIGWLATRAREVCEGALAVREQVTITNAALSEAIAERVLERRAEFLGRARKHAAANRSVVEAWMASNPSLEWVSPEGGVVALPRFTRKAWGGDPEQLYQSLAADYGVFVIPGRCFGLPNSCFRLGFGGLEADLKTGLERIHAALRDATVA